MTRRRGVADLRVWVSRVLGVVRGGHGDDELRAEIQQHLDQLAEEYVRRGMTPAEARDAARRTFGNVDRVRAAYREQERLSWVDSLGRDAQFAVRLLARDRGFALTAILALGLGIGVNNMLVTIIYAHTLRGLPIDRVDRVLYVATFDDRVPDRALSYPDLQDVRTARSFTHVGAFANAPIALGDERRVPDRFEGAYVSAGAFETLGLAPILGRPFAPDDDGAGAAPVAILGSEAWQSRYGGAGDILGRSVLIDGTPSTVIGVMPSHSGFPSTAEVWLPLARMPGLAVEQRGARTLRVFGRIRDDVAMSDARAEIESIIERVARENPQTSSGLRARVTPINQRFLGRPTDPAWLAFITVGFLVLIVSCANVANLLLARSAVRAREIAIRSSLGASRWHIVGQLLIESVTLAMIGGVVGLMISVAGVRIFRAAIPENVLPYWLNYGMDARVFAALVAVSFGAVLLFGLVPAVQVSRTDVNRVLKDGGRTGTTSGSTHRWTTAFLVAQFALTVLLLAQVVTSTRNDGPDLLSDSAIYTSDTLTASITLPADRYRAAEQRADFYRRLAERLDGAQEIAAHAMASSLPVLGAAALRLEIQDPPWDAGAAAPSVRSVAIDPGYFATLALPLARGREFAAEDDGRAQPHVIVNQRFIEQFMPDRDPLGQRIRLTAPNAPAGAAAPEWLTIIGVAHTIRQRPSTTPDAVVYTPFAAAPPAAAALLVRGRGDSAATVAVLRAHVMAVDPHIPLYRVMALQRAVEDAEWNRRISSRTILTLTLITLAFSVVGLYAVTAHAVSQRTQEIGIRVALGAQPKQVRALVARRALVQVSMGLMLGIAATLAWDAAFFSGRVDLRFASPGTLIPLAALMTVVTLVACFVPVRRAARLDPVSALRQE